TDRLLLKQGYGGFNFSALSAMLGVSRSTLYEYYASTNPEQDRKSTRLNSSHVSISYAVFCLKKKKLIYRSTNLYVSYIWIVRKKLALLSQDRAICISMRQTC